MKKETVFCDVDDLSACGVYSITQISTGKIYIGSTTTSFKNRWRRHRYDLKNNSHHSLYLQRAYNKYGVDDFRFNVELVCPSDATLVEEQKYLDLKQSFLPAHGFNHNANSGGRKGRLHSVESIHKMRLVHAGFKHSEETKKQMSQTRKTLVISKENREKMIAPQRGKKRGSTTGEKNGNSKLTKDTVEKIKSEIELGKRVSEISKSLNLNYHAVNNIKIGRTWK
jgi:group I intron endonuclease